MSKEIECKIKISDRKEVAALLVKLGAQDYGDKHEKNWVFDTENSDLRECNKLLRIRSYDKNILTFKGPVEESLFKKREEIECELDSLENMRKILDGLGYREVWFYEKMRHKFSLDGCEIVLDKIPELGDFLEIEAPCEEVINSILAKLGISAQMHINESYLQLFAEHCEKEGKPLRDMKL